MAGAMPFSALTLPELLLGELGAEPGALLHAESVGERHHEPAWLPRLLRVGLRTGGSPAGARVAVAP